MSDDIHKAKTQLTHAKRERDTKAAEFWDKTIQIGQQSDAGKAIIRKESLMLEQRKSRGMKPG